MTSNLPKFSKKTRDEEMGEVLHDDYKEFESKHYNLKDIFTLPCFETSNKSLYMFPVCFPTETDTKHLMLFSISENSF